MRRLPPAAEYDGRLRALRAEAEGVPAGDVESRRRLMEQITRLQGEQGVALFLRPEASGVMQVEVQAIVLGDGCAILALPGEFFVESGRAIQAAAGIPHLLVACYANHHVMYVVPRHEFARGGYEPGVAILDEDAEEAFRGAAVDLLREVAAM